MTAGPRIILSVGKIAAPPDAVLLDLRHHAIWHRSICVMQWKNGERYPRRLQTRFLATACLLCAYPNMVSHADIIDYVCGSVADGGPDDIGGSVAATLSYAKNQIAFIGFRVVNQWGVGYRLETIPQRQTAAA